MQGQMNDNDQSNQAKVWEMIRNIKIAMLTTYDAEMNSLRSRPMATLPKQSCASDGCVWFFTQRDSHKMQETQENARVNVSYSDPSKNAYVSLSGVATHVYDKERLKELWSESFRTWFPGGVDDPHTCLLCIKIDLAEYWDVPSSKMIHAFGYLKAKLMGHSPPSSKGGIKGLGDHGALSMSTSSNSSSKSSNLA
eukprot:ANDGO_03697.mRNA.1 hypothetical protein